MFRILMVTFALFGVAGCWDVALDELRFACESGEDCAPGRLCADGLCVPETECAAAGRFEPTEMTCDAVDNDCDGETDELGGAATANQRGVCAGATMVCDVRGLLEGYRDDATWEAAEITCDAKDNDCDGETDEVRADSADGCGSCEFVCAAPADECVGGACHDSQSKAPGACGYWVGPRDSEKRLDAEMCAVDAGTYPIGDPPADHDLPGELLIDRFEVTNARYAEYAATLAAPASALPTCAGGDGGWAGYPPELDGDAAEAPVTCVTRAQAVAFCEWAGKRLPSATEWEAAARGADGRLFPWGSTADSGVSGQPIPPANCRKETATSAVCADRWEGAGPVMDLGGSPTLVAGSSPCGALLMSGNVAEWVSDGPADAGQVRGGSWAETVEEVTVLSALVVSPNEPLPTVGFRCAMAHADAVRALDVAP